MYDFIPVAIGATEIVTKGLKKNLQAIPGKHSTDSLQNTAVLGTSRVIQKVLQKREWWGLQLAEEEKCQGEKDCDIIIMTTTTTTCYRSA